MTGIGPEGGSARYGKSERFTFEIFSCQQNGAQMAVLNQGTNLGIDGGTIKPHHEELAHLSVTANQTWQPWSATASKTETCRYKELGIQKVGIV